MHSDGIVINTFYVIVSKCADLTKSNCRSATAYKLLQQIQSQTRSLPYTFREDERE